MRKLFYCSECDRVLMRLLVTAEYDNTYQPTYYCRRCGQAVMQGDKVLRAMLKDYCQYICKEGEEDRYT